MSASGIGWIEPVTRVPIAPGADHSPRAADRSARPGSPRPSRASFRAVRRNRSDRGYAAIVTTPPDEPVGYTEIRALPEREHSTYSRRSQTVSTVKKSQARIAFLYWRRNDLVPATRPPAPTAPPTRFGTPTPRRSVTCPSKSLPVAAAFQPRAREKSRGNT
jgi:hypothetical protein